MLGTMLFLLVLMTLLYLSSTITIKVYIQMVVNLHQREIIALRLIMMLLSAVRTSAYIAVGDALMVGAILIKISRRIDLLIGV